MTSTGRAAAVAVALGFSICRVSNAADTSFDPLLQAGFQDMYAMDFPGCERRFLEYARLEPADPLGDAAHAACILFKEFQRAQVLDAEFYTDDKKLFGKRTIEPDAEAHARLTALTDRAIERAAEVLQRNPRDEHALFARAMANGLKADALALLDHRYLAASRIGKIALADADTLVALNPTTYDAYIWPGVSNYVAGSLPFPLRWLAKLRGFPTDTRRGIANLELAAEKGQLLKPYAKILLVVVHLRAADRAAAYTLLKELSAEFPSNPVFQKHVRRLEGSLGPRP